MPERQINSHSLSKMVLKGTLAIVLMILAIAGGIIAYLWLYKDDIGNVSAEVGLPVTAINPVIVAESVSDTEADIGENGANEMAPDQFASNGEQADELLEIAPNPLQAKPIRGTASNRAHWTPTPMPTSTPLPTPSPIPTFVGELPSASFEFPSGIQPSEKWIDVNLTSQTLVAYEGSTPVYRSLVSSGTTRNPTVTGQFRIWLRFASQDMNGYRLGYDYFLQDVPYVQYFFEDYALHGTFWHNNFGTPMSHGCVNLPTPAAEWLFYWASNGTLVNIHS